MTDASQGPDLSGLVDSIEDYAVLLLGLDGKILSWNRGAALMTGCESAEVLGSSFAALRSADPEEEKKVRAALEQAAVEGRFEENGVFPTRRHTQVRTRTVITPVRNPAGEITGFATVIRPIGKETAQEDLRHSEEMFRLLVASVKEYAIFLLDPEGYIVTWNAGAERIKGYKPEEIIGRHLSTFYPEEDVRAGKIERKLAIAREKGSVEDEGWRVRKDGTRFWANVVITAVYDARGELRGFAKVTRDLTERKRAEEIQLAFFEQRQARLHAEEERRRAETSYRVAQEANRAKDEFLMTLSHELRTPLTSILGWARLLPDIRPQDEAFREAVSAIGRGAQLQARLIDDVLDVSRIVSGKLRLQVEDVDVQRLLTAAIETVRPGADARMITITTSFSPQLGTIVGDPTRLQQVVWNLLTNAVKFTPKEGSIEVRARRTSSHVQIDVRDTGEGIDPGFLPHVFEPFRQAENPSTRTHGGLGLGLSIVRYLVEAHGGNVAVESEGRGKGTTFTVTLPIGALTAHAAEPTVIRALTPAEPVRKVLSGTSILLVDDDEEGRRMVSAVLRQAGARLTAVESAPLALESLAADQPDLVITDIAMPDMDGYSLAGRIRERTPGQRIMALSAFPAGRPGMPDAAFNAYVTKPVEPADLVKAIVGVLSR